MMLILCTIYILASVLTEVSSQEPTVTITQGEIRGKQEISDGSTIWAFRGIPYAKPPIEALRLKNPEAHEGWSSTLDATNFKSKCPQLDYQGKIDGSEDCLYLNVFTPVMVGGFPSVYPVMVFIHGGNFQKGSSDLYDPKQLVKSENNVIVVTFNYRIGVLGFLSTGDKTCPGNFGLKDQVMALTWIRNNIEKFGGDKNSITLFGQGAGAVSVFLHILSPQSKDLFQRAITQSGSPLCNWTLSENPNSHAREVAQRLRCSTKPSQAMFDCIQAADISKLLEAQRNEKSFGDFPLEFAPVVEKDGFLPDTPDNLLNSPNFRSIPLVSGINKDDGALFYTVMKSYEDALRRNSTNSSLVDEFLLRQLIPLFLLTTTDIRGNIESVSQVIHFQYFNGIDRANFTQILQSFINMTTDAMFTSCNYKTLESYSAKGAATYMYTFEYKGENSMLDLEQRQKVEYNGVSYGDELLYLFDVKNIEVSSSQFDRQVKGRLTYLWTFFATKGEFSGLNYMYSSWPPYSTKFRNYYRFELNPTNQSSYRQKEADLWLNHLPALSKIKPDGDLVEYKAGGFAWTMLAIAIILLIVVVVLSVLLLRKSKNQYFSTKTEEK